jgi:hypothetical protein
MYLARKYRAKPDDLIDAFVEAYRNMSSCLDPLRITCRDVDYDSAMFLITNNEQVVTQFPINLKYLETPITLKSDCHNIPMPLSPLKQSMLRQKTVSELTAGMKGITVKATITEIPPIRNVLSKWGEPCSVSNVKLTDETGSIKLAS